MPVNACCCGGGYVPDCCTANGCRFDQNRARLTGHIYYHVRWYTSTDCSGTAGFDLLFEADYDLGLMGGCGKWATQVSTISPAFLSNVVAQMNGVDVTIDGSGDSNISFLIGGGGSFNWDGQWHPTMQFNMNVAPPTVAPWSGSQSINSPDSSGADSVAGDCTGFTTQTFGGCFPNSIYINPGSGFHSVRIDSTWSALVKDNAC